MQPTTAAPEAVRIDPALGAIPYLHRATRGQPMDELHLDEVQDTAILGLELRRLTRVERGPDP
jgi:hypothetical protein